jgi:hypothetical protein
VRLETALAHDLHTCGLLARSSYSPLCARSLLPLWSTPLGQYLFGQYLFGQYLLVNTSWSSFDNSWTTGLTSFGRKRRWVGYATAEYRAALCAASVQVMAGYAPKVPDPYLVRDSRFDRGDF